MADNKLQKALYGPSPWEVATGAILGILVGLVGSCLYLVFKPVESVRIMPKEPVPNVIYFMPGRESTVKTKDWKQKLKTFVEGGEVLLSEEDLNTWAKTVGKATAPEPTKPKSGTVLTKQPAADPAKDKPMQTDFIAAGGLNFRIKDRKLQIAFKCSLNYYGIGSDVWVLTTGGFARDGQHYVFDPDTFYFGSCPLHKMPGVSQFVAERMMAVLGVPEDVRLALDKMTAASFDGDLLKISTKP